MARLFLARMARMKRYRQVDATILLRTNGTNIKSFLSLAKIVLFVPFVRRQVDGTIISCTKGAKLFIYARMARMKRYRQVDGTINSCTNGTNDTISTSRCHDSSSHEWHDIDKSIARLILVRKARMKRYRQVDGTILLRTNGTNETISTSR